VGKTQRPDIHLPLNRGIQYLLVAIGLHVKARQPSALIGTVVHGDAVRETLHLHRARRRVAMDNGFTEAAFVTEERFAWPSSY